MTHGNSGYAAGCRCDDCRTGHAQAVAEMRARRNPPEHGVSGYYNHDCRCDICIETSKAWRNSRRVAAASGPDDFDGRRDQRHQQERAAAWEAGATPPESADTLTRIAETT